MSKCVNGWAPALCAGLLASIIVPFAGARADDCLTTEPTRAAAPGSHWVYHMDRATNRKCWFLVQTGALPPAAPPAGQPPAPDPASPAFGSLFSWWTAGSNPPAAAPNSGAPEARPTAESRARPPRQMDAQAAPQAAPTPKPHRPAAAHAPTAHGDEHAPLTEQERDALFQDFLRWKDGQKPQ